MKAEMVDWNVAKTPFFSVIHGRYCDLIPMSDLYYANDLYDLWHDRPCEWDFLPINFPDSLALFKEWLSELISKKSIHYAIVNKAMNEVVGTVALMSVDEVNGVVEIGWVMWGPQMKRSFLGTESIFLLLTSLFDALGYRKVQWRCDDLNIASKNSALRYGFLYEGTFRQAMVVKGRNRDTTWFGMTDKRWKEIIINYQRWLADDNFDSNKNQLHKLDINSERFDK